MIHGTDEMVVEFTGKLPKDSDFEPGTNWSYSTSAYSTLGGVVEGGGRTARNRIQNPLVALQGPGQGAR